jgi:hypothetical protein
MFPFPHSLVKHLIDVEPLPPGASQTFKESVMKLFKVKCRGMNTQGFGNDIAHGLAYVVAEDPTEAYQKVRYYLDAEKIGVARDKELESIELLAEDAIYPSSGIKLYL